jgi:S1-C subfamily serine protease
VALGERAVLKRRRQPETVNNHVSVTINHLVGQFAKRKYRIPYAGRNPDKDQAGADALSDIMLSSAS